MSDKPRLSDLTEVVFETGKTERETTLWCVVMV